MARGLLSPITSGRTPASAVITWVAANATDKHKFDNSAEDCMLLIRNMHTADHTVTIQRPASVDGQALGNMTVTVTANGGVAILGPFPNSLYAQVDVDTAKAVLVDPPATPTALTFAVIKRGAV